MKFKNEKTNIFYVHSHMYFFCYQTELGSAHPPHSKANLLTLVCGEGKFGAYLQGTKQGEQWLMLKDPNKRQMAFREWF